MQQDWRASLSRYAVFAWLFVACLWSWPMFAAAPRGGGWPLVALLGPTVAALVLIALTDGRDGYSRLAAGFLPRWRQLPWLVIAVLLPILLVVPIVGMAVVTGVPFALKLAEIGSDAILVAVLVVFVEIGFRGYALDALLRVATPRVASVLIGFAWALWAMPRLVMPDLGYTGVQIGLHAVLLIVWSVVFAWMWLKTRGSLWVAWALHATVLLVAIDANPAQRLLPVLIIYALIAALVALGGTMRRDRRVGVATPAASARDRDRGIDGTTDDVILT